jgi:uncharacterized protein YqjF (DUF2071 family)
MQICRARSIFFCAALRARDSVSSSNSLNIFLTARWSASSRSHASFALRVVGMDGSFGWVPILKSAPRGGL